MFSWWQRHGKELPSAAILSLVAIVACASPQWQREGSTANDLESDRAECLKESGNTTGVMNLRTSRFIKRCLQERGWTQPDKSNASEATPAEVPILVEPASQEPPSSGVSFDECFERCRELTDRTKEQCFDACL